jgi:hypothetical protein
MSYVAWGKERGRALRLSYVCKTQLNALTSSQKFDNCSSGSTKAPIPKGFGAFLFTEMFYCCVIYSERIDRYYIGSTEDIGRRLNLRHRFSSAH